MAMLTAGWQILTGLLSGGQGIQQLALATGHLDFLLLSICVATGLLAHTRWLGRTATWWMNEVHDWSGAWTVYVGLMHALLFHYGREAMSWASILLPNLSGHRGLALAVGIYGLYAFIAVTVSGYLLGAIKGYLWRWLHWLSFPAWLLSLIHVLMLVHGMRIWMLWLYGGSAVVVVGLTAARFLGRKPVRRPTPAQ